MFFFALSLFASYNMAKASAQQNKYKQMCSDDEVFEPPPLFGSFFEGWSSFFSSEEKNKSNENLVASPLNLEKNQTKPREEFDSEESSASSESSFYCLYGYEESTTSLPKESSIFSRKTTRTHLRNPAR